MKSFLNCKDIHCQKQVKIALISLCVAIVFGFLFGFSIYSDSCKHLFFGIATYDFIFLFSVCLIKKGSIDITKKEIDNLNVIFISIFYSLFIACLINFDSELVIKTSFHEQQNDIIWDFIGTFTAFINHLLILFFYKK